MVEGNREVPGSLGPASCGGSSRRRRSFNSLSISPSQMDVEAESESVSEAGDIGDRAIHSRNDSLRLSFDRVSESSAVVFRIAEVKQMQCYASQSDHPEAALEASVSEELVFENDRKELSKVLEYGSCLTQLAVFGILGVLTRYSLQKLFGPGIAGVTSDGSILYLDLPSNMVGSFFMGWFGVVFKPDIARVSEFLAIGLTTGYLGSLTTFSGWNQKMLELSVEGQWVSAILGFLIGLFLAAYSIIFGVETARGFRVLLEKKIKNRRCEIGCSSSIWTVDSYERHIQVMVVFVLLLGLLWSLSGVLLREEFGDGTEEAQLWLGCLVGPLGVWMRWFLARLNGRGLGRAGHLKWIPFGTLIANVSACSLMAALTTVRTAVNTKACNTITIGIQLGFLGCLSTVSTFIAEFNAMRESTQPWRAYAYAMITICVSFGAGVLIYSVPVWTKGFE